MPVDKTGRKDRHGTGKQLTTISDGFTTIDSAASKDIYADARFPAIGSCPHSKVSVLSNNLDCTSLKRAESPKSCVQQLQGKKENLEKGLARLLCSLATRASPSKYVESTNVVPL
jgi:hypothetical protein